MMKTSSTDSPKIRAIFIAVKIDGVKSLRSIKETVCLEILLSLQVAFDYNHLEHAVLSGDCAIDINSLMSQYNIFVILTSILVKMT